MTKKPITSRRIRYASDKIAKAFMDAVAADVASDAAHDRTADEFDAAMIEMDHA